MPDRSHATTTAVVDFDELQQLFETSRNDLKRLVDAKLDRRLTGRVDASDIVQDAYLEASRRFPEYIQSREVPLIEWLRFLTAQTVNAAHRHHLGRQKRNICREAEIAGLDSTANNIAELLSGSLTNPHAAAVKAELKKTVRHYIESMNESDREILRLRHEELLSSAECAQRLGISDSAASKRYIRAIERLRAVATEYLQ